MLSNHSASSYVNHQSLDEFDKRDNDILYNESTFHTEDLRCNAILIAFDYVMVLVDINERFHDQ